MESRLLHVVIRALCLTSLALPARAQIASFCPGDGSLINCPCGNNGATAHGCANSAFTSGALLTGSGNPAWYDDTVVLTASNMTGGICVFFQGDAQVSPLVLDDGLGCVSGSVIRLGIKSVSGGASSYPSVGDAPITVRGGITASNYGPRYYQCFYRNAAQAFCPPALSNRINMPVIPVAAKRW